MTRSLVTNDVNDLRRLLTGGLIPAVPVPLDNEGRLHRHAQESYQRYMSTQEIAGVAVWAHTGRGLHLDDATSKEVLKNWRAALPDKVVVAGVGAKHGDESDPTLSTLKMAESAASSGADAFLVYAPTWLRDVKDLDRAIIDHHNQLSAMGVPLILFYLYEEAGGISYGANVLDELLSLPNVIGIKVATLDSVMTYQDISQQIQSRHPDKLLITGEDRFLGYSLRRGAGAALVGMGAVCTELQVELLKAHFGGNSERFLQLSDIVDALAESLFVRPMEGYIKRTLLALAHLGVIPFEAANDPWGPDITAEEVRKIGNVVDSLAVYSG
jgi:4-hydroxy-tetrahydrodipicolinate synthase